MNVQAAATAAILCVLSPAGPASAGGEGAVTVTVVTASGGVVRDALATVWEFGRRRDGATEWTLVRARTNSAGEVTLSPVDLDKRYRLEIVPPSDREDLASLDDGMWRPASETRVLPKGFTIVGKVEDPLGRPLGNATVERLAVVLRPGSSMTTASGRALDETGAFRFEHVPAHRQFLRAFRHDERYHEHDVTVAIASPEHPRVTLVLAKDDEASLVRRRVDGLAAAQKVFLIAPPWDNRGRESADLVFPSGLVWTQRGDLVSYHMLPRLEVADDGTVRLKATFEALTGDLWVPPVSPDSDRSLYVREAGFAEPSSFALSAGATLRGRLTGDLSAGDGLRVFAVGPRRILVEGRVGTDRTFEVRGMPPGRWTVVAERVRDGKPVRALAEGDASSSIDLAFK